MRLKNKKTGEIRNIKLLDINDYLVKGGVTTWKGEPLSLAVLNAEWEDAPEEPKEYWYLTMDGEVRHTSIPEFVKYSKQIGNYFETKEEAEKAVEKLKAWKRLKDKGLRFERWLLGGEYGNTITFSDYIEYDDETRADLNLLFGGEE